MTDRTGSSVDRARRVRFRDRREAGRVLAGRLSAYADRDEVVVLALPRGGVPVGYELADALGAPLHVFAVRKVGVPGYEELAMGAVASGGVLVLDHAMVQRLRIRAAEVERAVASERRELERREGAYREGRDPPQLEGKIAILVDDGLATGSTMRAAARAVRQHRPARVVVAVPVAAAETCNDFGDDADEVVCVLTPTELYAVGLWYDDFSQTTDDEVRELLALAAASRRPSTAETADAPSRP
jgi:predicted phosphoribosyltransferase